MILCPSCQAEGRDGKHNAPVQRRRVSDDVDWNPLSGPLEFERLDCFFPVLPIKRSNLDIGLFHFKVVKTSDVDTVHVRGCPRITEWMDSAVFAEPVFGRFRTELIERERILPRK